MVCDWCGLMISMISLGFSRVLNKPDIEFRCQSLVPFTAAEPLHFYPLSNAGSATFKIMPAVIRGHASLRPKVYLQRLTLPLLTVAGNVRRRRPASRITRKSQSLDLFPKKQKKRSRGAVLNSVIVLAKETFRMTFGKRAIQTRKQQKLDESSPTDQTLELSYIYADAMQIDRLSPKRDHQTETIQQKVGANRSFRLRMMRLSSDDDFACIATK